MKVDVVVNKKKKSRKLIKATKIQVSNNTSPDLLNSLVFYC